MRWVKSRYTKDQIRFRTAFLILPKTLKNKIGETETRWLEKVMWAERFIGYGDSGTDYWTEIRWIDEDEA